MKKFRFLIARIDRIGDVVLSTPLPREIKKKYPDSFVCLLVRNYTRDIYYNNPYVDLIITYDNEDGSKKFFRELLNEIRKIKFSHSLMLLPEERLNYLLFLAGIPYRIGVGHKLYQMITLTKYVDRKKYNPLRHEADYNLDMLRKIGIETEDNTPEIFLSEEEVKKATALKEKFTGSSRKLVGINVSSGNSAPNLKPEEYKKLMFILLKNSEFKVAVMDNKIPSVVDNIDGVIYPNRNNDLRDSIINISTLYLLVSNSTGPMHIASALKVPTLSLFCPLTACSPKLWGPLGNNSEIIMPSTHYCSTQCPVDPKKCDYSKEGGLNSEYIAERLYNFIEKLNK
jgi:ADP-heptose:LPS heptosyltransferase